MDSDQDLGWLALALTPGLGPRLAGKLLGEFGSPEAVSRAPLTALEARDLPVAQAADLRLQREDEPKNSERRREICDPPSLRYVLGNIDFLKRQILAIGGRDGRPLPGIKWPKG